MHPLRGTLALLAVLSLPVWAQTPAEILKRVTANYRSLAQTTYDFEMTETREYSGSISNRTEQRWRVVGDSGRYRQETLPSGTLYISDGLDRWTYDPGRNEYTKSKGGLTQGPAPFLDLFQQYNLDKSGARLVGHEKLEIVSGSVACEVFEVDRATGQPPAKYWIDAVRDLVMKVSYKQTMPDGLPESVVTVALVKASIRQPVDKDLLRFQPPQGAVQVEQLGFGTKPAAEGKPAPDLSLQGPDGKPIPLSKLRGAPVLLYFAGDDRDQPVLEWIDRAQRGKGLTVLYVQPANTFMHAPDSRIYSMRTAQDSGSTVAKAMGVAYKGIVLLDSSGTVVFTDTVNNWQRLATELQRLHVW